MLYLIIEGLFFGLLAALAAFIISPVQYLKIIRQETGAAYTKILKTTLREKNPLKVFYRGALPYTIMNFLSNAAFGLSDYISNLILHSNNNSNILNISNIDPNIASGADIAINNIIIINYSLFTGVALRSFLGGIIETLFTIYPEIQEILRNKGQLVKDYSNSFFKNASKIIFPIFFRNSIAWVGITLSYEISIRYSVELKYSIILSLIIGLIFGFFSLPLDVIVTQNCGGITNLSVLQRLSQIFRKDQSRLLAGATIRIGQICIFTLVTVLSMFLFSYYTNNYF